MLIWSYFGCLKVLKRSGRFFLYRLGKLFQELYMVIVIFMRLQLLLSCLTCAIVVWRKIYFKLEECIHYFIDVLVNTDEIILNQVSLTKLNPFFALFLLTLELIDVVNIVILLLALFRLAHW